MPHSPYKKISIHSFTITSCCHTYKNPLPSQIFFNTLLKLFTGVAHELHVIWVVAYFLEWREKYMVSDTVSVSCL